MMKIGDAILISKGPHPDRLRMHPRTLWLLGGEPESIYDRMKRDPNGDWEFLGTSIVADIAVPHDQILFERRCDLCDPLSSFNLGVIPSTATFTRRTGKCTKCDGTKWVVDRTLTMESE